MKTIHKTKIYFIVTLIGLYLLSFVGYFYLQNNDEDRLFNLVKGEAQSFSTVVDITFIERLLALDRMADRFTFTTEERKISWSADAFNYMNHFAGFASVRWLSKDQKTIWKTIVDKEDHFYEKINIFPYLEQATAKQLYDGFFVNQTIADGQHNHLVSIHPTRYKGEVTGAIVAIYSLKSLFESIISSNYKASISIGNEIVYQSDFNDEVRTPGISYTHGHEFSGLEISITLYPTILSDLDKTVKFNRLLLILFLFISTLVSFSFYQKMKHEDNIFSLNKQFMTIKRALDQTALVSEADLDGNITFVNDKMCSLSGYTEAELLGRNHRILRSGYHDKKFFEQMWTTISSGEVWHGEIKNRAKDGNYYWVDSSIYPNRDINGRIQNYVSIRHDITELKNQEIDIIRNNQEKDIINNLLQIKSSTDIPLETKLSQAITKLLEIPWLALLNKGGVFLREGDQLRLVVSNNLGEKIETLCERVDMGHCLCGRAMELKKTIHASCVDETHEIQFDGMRDHGHYNIPLKSSNEVIGVIVLYLSHGHQKNKAEIEFLESCAEVFTRIIVSHQTELEIIKTRDMALKAEKIKSEFLANMSHEIRTPMNAIMGMIDLLSSTELSEEQSDMVETTRGSVDGLMFILNDILDLSKIESGKLELERVAFDLTRTVKDVVTLMSSKAKEQDLYLKCEFPNEYHNFYFGDVGRIRQIIVNYISNAIKFTETGGVTVKVDFPEVNKGRTKLRISVVDTGLGIKDEVKSKLFQAFTQADATTTRKFGGTGLGLSICSKLATLMSGNVFLESEPGKGSTFGFVIPLEKAQESDNVFSNADSTQGFNLNDFKTHKILVVEDNKVNQKLAKMIFHKLGHDIDIAENGQEALELYASGDYTLVFMDMQMPVKDGLTATRELAAKYGGNLAPIVAMTANAFKEDKDKCFAAGMKDFISKPIKKSEIIRVLKKFGYPI
jgi:PAS domain S-box-containing protein